MRGVHFEETPRCATQTTQSVIADDTPTDVERILVRIVDLEESDSDLDGHSDAVVSPDHSMYDDDDVLPVIPELPPRWA